MRNDYQYVDTDFAYVDPKTGVLRNLGGITDRDALNFVEIAATIKRTRELKSMNDTWLGSLTAMLKFSPS